MKHIKIIRLLASAAILAGVGFASLPAVAATMVSGPVEVLEGDLLRVGGQTVRLYGIDAPEKGQMCAGPKREHDCGHIAATGLMDLTAGVERVTCEILGKAFDGNPIARCIDPQGFDLSRQMLYTGWAFATPAASVGFHQLAEDAQSARRGMWKWQVMRPWRWITAGEK